MMIVAGEVVRIINITLAVVSVFAMSMVTWRLMPKMKWYEKFARQGVTASTAGIVWGSFVGLRSSAPYGGWTFLLTLGLATSLIGFTAWAWKLPRRKRHQDVQ